MREQLHESSVRRRTADLLLSGENEKIPHKELFRRFESRCFKTGKALDLKKRSTWAIDHVLPSHYLYPLQLKNACLLSRDANQAKKGRWPRDFYTNSQLVKLAKIIGADLTLMSGPPTVNPNIDVNRCVTRMLKVRENSNLEKRVGQLMDLLKKYGLIARLSQKNRQLLGLRDHEAS